MATVTIPSTPLPDPGDEMDAEQVRDWTNNIITFLEGTNIDEANVDLAGTDGIMGKSTAQTITGLKSFESTAVAAGGIREVMEFGLDPASGTPAANDGGRLVFYADDAGGAESDIAYIDWVMTTATAGGEVGRLDFYVAAVGNPVSQVQILDGSIQPTTDSDVSLGITGTRWSNLFTDAATIGGALTVAGAVSVDDTTETTSGITGSIHTDGGLGVAKDIFIGDDILIATGGLINFDGGNVVLTHSSGVLNVSTGALQVGGVAVVTVAGAALTGSTNNTITTVTGADAIQGEANLTFDGSTLAVAGTVEPSGDTAAGDNSAFGYTSAEGAILTGQGSTSDITLKNDADAVVMQVATGTGDITMPLQPSFLVQNTGSTDVTGDGTVATIAWATEIKDQGSDFASNTFTAPATGNYQMSIMIRLDDFEVDTYERVQIQLVTSNRSYNLYDGAPDAGNSGLLGISGCIMADMDAADTATVTAYVATGTKSIDVGATLTVWSGFLAN